MAIPFEYTFVRSPQSINLSKVLFDDDKSWLVWWYSGILKNTRSNYQPHVLVGFRQITDGIVSGEVTYCRVLLTTLGSLRIGSVWKNGRCQAIAQFEEREFNITFKNNFWHTSFNKAYEEKWEYPFTQSIYPLDYGMRDRNILLQCKANSNELVTIPSLEFYSRLYGGSEDVRRVLATFSYKKCKTRLILSQNQPDEDGLWKIVRGKNLRKSDDVYLAHLKEDPWTQYASKKIYAQIESESGVSKKAAADDPNRPRLNFIEVDPWFQGETTLILRGISFNNGRNFLGLQIMGFSYPMGPPIRVLRQKKDGSLVQEENPDGGRGRVRLDIITPPEEALITDDVEPNQGGSIALIENPELIVRNPGRDISEMPDDPSGDGGTIDWYSNEKSSMYSTSEPRGAGGDVGRALIHTPHVMESKGILLDIWDELMHLSMYSSEVQGVSWYTFEDKFQNNQQYKLVRIDEFDDEAEVDGEVRNWVYIDPKKKKNRGALVARIIVSGMAVYLVEIERRLIIKDGLIKEKPMTGFVFTLSDPEAIKPCVQTVLSEIRHKLGVFKKIKGLIPGMKLEDFFKHPSVKPGERPGESAVRNALRKVDISLKESHAPKRNSKLSS